MRAKTNKKLSLNKETLRSLSSGELSNVVGGVSDAVKGCVGGTIIIAGTITCVGRGSYCTAGDAPIIDK